MLMLTLLLKFGARLGGSSEYALHVIGLGTGGWQFVECDLFLNGYNAMPHLDIYIEIDSIWPYTTRLLIEFKGGGRERIL
jgi:hypothetical protein